ncbi:hypothetical protein L9F63_017958, partial [Diploptera punctata]
DLSETAISQMPTAGLKDLEILRLQDTDSLKMFPSIYNFEYLRVAWLTYPYHCCAFQFPAMHHPEEFIKHEANVHSTSYIFRFLFLSLKLEIYPIKFSRLENKQILAVLILS